MTTATAAQTIRYIFKCRRECCNHVFAFDYTLSAEQSEGNATRTLEDGTVVYLVEDLNNGLRCPACCGYHPKATRVNGRQPLNIVEEGLIFKQLQEDKGWTQEEIAEKLIVPGKRSHVATCLSAAEAPPDIQEMLRHDPKRGHRCFLYLKRLDVLGDEKAISLRAPLIRDFLIGKISTDEVSILVQQILQRELAQETEQQTMPLDDVRKMNNIQSTVKSFRRFEKEIGEAKPTEQVRIELLQLKTKIESILNRE